MKKTIFLIALLISSITFAQSSGFNYKALVVDNGTPVASRIITVKTKLKSGSSTKWYEQHNNVHTDANGIFSLSIGNGTRISGVTHFGDIDWRLYDNMKLTVEVNTGSGFHTLVNNVPFGSVPYAKQAKRANLAQEAMMAGALVTHDPAQIFAVGTGNNGLLKFTGTSNEDWYFDMNADNDLTIVNDGQSPSIKLPHDTRNVIIGGELQSSSIAGANMMPVAYGYIYHTGSISDLASTNNFSVTKDGTGRYTVSITGLGQYYTVVVSAINDNGSARMAHWKRNSGNFNVYINDSSNSYTDNGFSFIVYKL